MFSNDFRVPLSSTLMMLQSLLAITNDEAQRRIILIMVSQINLLICLINDILDLKMMQQNKFEKRI